ncbi:hypothetical protein [Paenibacillus xylanexedens]|uniref:hypothetical protein n=1 Tax=Paenibacillus xylanexedens TaxID=528191 RepID=UPI001643BC5F|nr:hypothetical protein [Paenibacillus xylanexedens]
MIEYRQGDSEEIVEALELTDFWFSCAIVSKGTAPGQFNSYLSYTEQGLEPEDPDGMVLYITRLGIKRGFWRKLSPN